MLRSSGTYELAPADRELASSDLAQFIYRQAVRKSFRKWRIDEETQRRITRSIALNMEKKEPIQFSFPFGAYKGWNLPSAPGVDWAEFFSLVYYIQYMAPIAAAYEPGCTFSFVGDDIIVPRLDNIPAEKVAEWSKGFESLLAAFRPHLPSNMRIELRHVGEFYTSEEFECELKEKYPEAKAEWDGWSDEEKASHIASSRHNICWNGIEDLTKLSEKEKEEKIIDSALMHNAYRHLSRRKAFTRAEQRIAIFPRPIASYAVPLGTTKSSAVYFWVGVGVLEQREEKFVERIFSFDQYEKIKKSLHGKEVAVAVIPFTSIPVLTS